MIETWLGAYFDIAMATILVPDLFYTQMAMLFIIPKPHPLS